MTMIGSGFWELPGITATLETTENIIWWGNRQWQRLRSDVIASAAVDAGADPTTLLKQGLIMGKASSGASSGKLLPWSPFATDGSQYIHGVLVVDQSMLTNNVARDRWFGWCFVGGSLKANSLLIAGANNTFGLSGHLLEYQVRHLMTSTGRWQLDDQLQGSSVEWNQYKLATTLTLPTAYTIVAADNNSLFLCNNTALTAFTLPTPVIGLRYGFYAMHDSGFSVTSATAGDLIYYADAAANAITFSTTGKVVGTFLELVCIPTAASLTAPAAKWMVKDCSAVTSDGVHTLPVLAT
jgi:hypothetical protein